MPPVTADFEKRPWEAADGRQLHRARLFGERVLFHILNRRHESYASEHLAIAMN